VGDLFFYLHLKSKPSTRYARPCLDFFCTVIYFESLLFSLLLFGDLCQPYCYIFCELTHFISEVDSRIFIYRKTYPRKSFVKSRVKEMSYCTDVKQRIILIWFIFSIKLFSLLRILDVFKLLRLHVYNQCSIIYLCQLIIEPINKPNYPTLGKLSTPADSLDLVRASIIFTATV